jgi:hypothetical protein
MPSISSFTSALGLLSLLPAARAGWNQNSNDNIVVYWGNYLFSSVEAGVSMNRKS